MSAPITLPTVRDVVALPEVELGDPRLVAGALGDRSVRWVHVSEVADLTDLVSGDELVLTIGTALTGTAERCAAYIRDLVAAGVAGLIVEVGTLVDAVPAAARAVADDLGFPVIELHRTTRFVAITEAVHRIIVADQYAELEFAAAAHQTFITLNVERASLTRIVSAAAEILDRSVVLEDLAHQVLAFRPAGAGAGDLLEGWTRRSRLVASSDTTVRDEIEGWTHTPVGPVNEVWGRLVVVDPRDEIGPSPTARSRTRLVIERAAQAVTLHRMVERDRTSLHQQAQSGLLEDLARRELTDEHEARSRAGALGLAQAARYVPLTVRLSPFGGGDPVAAHQRGLHALDGVVHAVAATSHSALTALRRESEVAVLLAVGAGRAGSGRPGHDTHLDDVVDLVAGRIRTQLRRLEASGAITIGVGRDSARLTTAATALDESAQIAEVAAGLSGSTRLYHRATDVRLRGLVALLRDDARVQKFAESELGPLLASDARHGESNLDVLRRFLELGGNKSELATDLGRSRQTVYQRLALIERLLGVSLDDAESCTSLHTAVLIHDAAGLTGVALR